MKNQPAHKQTDHKTTDENRNTLDSFNLFYEELPQAVTEQTNAQPKRIRRRSRIQ